LNIAGSMASSQMCPAHLHLISGKTDGWSDNYQEWLLVVNTYTTRYTRFKNRFEIVQKLWIFI